METGTVSQSFQYIPCYGLSLREKREKRLQRDFNTSHVTVYPEKRWNSSQGLRFQYIPCYGLSINKKLAMAEFDDFNTSHVTVYPMTDT